MSVALTVSLVAVLAAVPAPAARWLTPDWGRAGPPACAPVALFWFTVDTCRPVPEGPDVERGTDNGQRGTAAP
jgi:hypothetical protein